VEQNLLKNAGGSLYGPENSLFCVVFFLTIYYLFFLDVPDAGAAFALAAGAAGAAGDGRAPPKRRKNVALLGATDLGAADVGAADVGAGGGGA